MGSTADAGGARARSWAAQDEDARWRVMPRYVFLVWLAVAIFQVVRILLMTLGYLSYDTFIVVISGGLAVVGLALSVLAISWTAARRDGLRVRNGWRTHEVLWQDVASVRPHRLLGFVLHTRDGGRFPMQGLNPGRLAHLTHIWSHYRGEDEPEQAITRQDQHRLR